MIYTYKFSSYVLSKRVFMKEGCLFPLLLQVILLKKRHKLGMHQSWSTKFCTVTPNTSSIITALPFPRCCSLRAQWRQRQATVRFAVHSRVLVPQYVTCFMSPFWRLKFWTRSTCFGKIVHYAIYTIMNMTIY